MTIINNSINKLLYDPLGQTIVSAIFGLAIALMFHRVCKDCTLYFAPEISDIRNNIFKLEDTCYKYEPVITECSDNDDKILKPYNHIVPENKIEQKKIISNITKN